MCLSENLTEPSLGGYIRWFLPIMDFESLVIHRWMEQLHIHYI